MKKIAISLVWLVCVLLMCSTLLAYEHDEEDYLEKKGECDARRTQLISLRAASNTSRLTAIGKQDDADVAETTAGAAGCDDECESYCDGEDEYQDGEDEVTDAEDAHDEAVQHEQDAEVDYGLGGANAALLEWDDAYHNMCDALYDFELAVGDEVIAKVGYDYAWWEFHYSVVAYGSCTEH